MRLARAEIPSLPLSVAITLLCLAASPAIRAQVPTSPAHFVGNVPCRLADTRGSGFSGQYGPPALAAGVPRNFMLTGQCGIPATAQAVSLNVTATNTQGPGFILIHPQGESQPVVSTLNYDANQTVANAAIVSLGTGGGITLIAGVSGTNLVLDTNGYFLDAEVEFRGAWSSATTYGLNDVVAFLGSNWVSLTSENLGNQPDTSPAQWALFTGTLASASGSFDISTHGSTSFSINGFGDVSLTGNLSLPDSTATTGNVLKNGFLFLHNFGIQNTFLGISSGNLTMSGGGNTGLGINALFSNTTGNANTAVGPAALGFNTTGSLNTAIGHGALVSNTSGNDNTAAGQGALASNTTGNHNTALGKDALFFGSSADDNTAIGHYALRANTTGGSNTAVGQGALNSNGAGSRNTAIGQAALTVNDAGFENTAVGRDALVSNTTGHSNTAVGESALNTNTTGVDNLALGRGAGSGLDAGSGNIYIGSPALVPGESSTTRIGITQTDVFLAGISGQTSSGGVPVLVNSAGKLGTMVSSRHYKEEIRDMGEASRALLQLRPVTFRYKPEAGDSEAQPTEYGFIAEEVAAIYPELVARTRSGEPQAVRYHLMSAMLLNELRRQEVEIRTLRQLVGEIELKRADEVADLLSRLARLEATGRSIGSAYRGGP